jgi:hypothetical protein
MAVCAMLAMGACRVDTTVHVKVNNDGSGTITLTAIADSEVVAQAPGLAEDLRFDDAVANGWVVSGPEPTADGGLRVEITHDFATVEEATALLQSINGTGGPLHDVTITRAVTNNELRTSLAGILRVDGELQAFSDSAVFDAIGGLPYAAAIFDTGLTPSDVVTFTFTADLPGEPVTTGTGPKPTLSWTVPISGIAAADLATTSVLSQGSGAWGTLSTVALIALIAWCVLAIAFIAFVAKARRKRARAALRVRPLTRR